MRVCNAMFLFVVKENLQSLFIVPVVCCWIGHICTLVRWLRCIFPQSFAAFDASSPNRSLTSMHLPQSFADFDASPPIVRWLRCISPNRSLTSMHLPQSFADFDASPPIVRWLRCIFPLGVRVITAAHFFPRITDSNFFFVQGTCGRELTINLGIHYHRINIGERI